MSFFGKTYWYPTPDFGPQEIGVVQMEDPTWYGVAWRDEERQEWHWLTGKRTALRELSLPEAMQSALNVWAKKRELKVANEAMESIQSIPSTDGAPAEAAPEAPEIAAENLGKGFSSSQNGEVLSTKNGFTAACCSGFEMAVQRVGLEIARPETEGEAIGLAKVELAAGVRTECRIGILLVWGLELSGKKVSAFVEDAKTELNVAVRQLYTYLAAGRMLLGKEFSALPDELKALLLVGADKLEMLAPVAKKGTGTLQFFLEHNDPRAMTREELSGKVELYLARLMPEGERQAAEAAAKKKLQEKSVTSIRNALKPLGAVENEAMKSAVQRVGPARCFDAGLRLLAAAVDAQMEAGAVAPETVDGWRQTLQECLDELNAQKAG